jgi:hypothetical protein
MNFIKCFVVDGKSEDGKFKSIWWNDDRACHKMDPHIIIQTPHGISSIMLQTSATSALTNFHSSSPSRFPYKVCLHSHFHVPFI